MYNCGEGRGRAGLVVVNVKIDDILLKQLSDKDTVPIQLITVCSTYFVVSMYLDKNEEIKKDCDKIENILKFTKR